MDNCQTFFLALLVLYIVIAWTAPKHVREAFTPIVDKVELGTIHIGPGGPNMTKSFNFQKGFSRAPFVFFSPLYGSNVTWTDVFQTTIQFTSPSSCRFNLQRVDLPKTSWGQNLKMMYAAISIQEGTPYQAINATVTPTRA